ncbi:MAG: hypothetical protein ACTTJK_03855 [Phocaeicola sp.]|uniref:hypothetical protein n=1 Tax=Phocaeicola sp. TaxID=2773926 RepID=UPI003FA0516F
MKAKISIKRLLLFLLMAMLTVGVSCRKDDDLDDKYQVIELNMDDHRFEHNGSKSFITNGESYGFNDPLVRLFKAQDDSIFISYYGVLLYPTRLPDDFLLKGVPFVFSGSVREKPEGADYYPILLSEFKYEVLLKH